MSGTPWGEQPLRVIGGPKDGEQYPCHGYSLAVAVQRHINMFRMQDPAEPSYDVHTYYPCQVPESGEWVLMYGPILAKRTWQP